MCVCICMLVCTCECVCEKVGKQADCSHPLHKYRLNSDCTIINRHQQLTVICVVKDECAAYKDTKLEQDTLLWVSRWDNGVFIKTPECRLVPGLPMSWLPWLDFSQKSRLIAFQCSIIYLICWLEVNLASCRNGFSSQSNFKDIQKLTTIK